MRAQLDIHAIKDICVHVYCITVEAERHATGYTTDAVDQNVIMI